MISKTDVFGIIKEKSSQTIVEFVLNSVNLNESVQTKTNFLFQSSSFDFISIQVKTGLKFFSVTEYSTFSIPFDNHCVSKVILLSCGTSGKATYSLADIPGISKLSFHDLIVIV
ncbi:hypothetical protein J5751_00980 [bacterium]|nr:hypothetical protein [bacterium]